MRRADRLFQIVQFLRGRRLTTAAFLAGRLGVSLRTVYRDVRDLSLSGVPVEGEAGVGYRLRAGFDVPPLMFTLNEIEALAVGARMVEAWGGPVLADSARTAIEQIVAPLPGRGGQAAGRFHPRNGGAVTRRRSSERNLSDQRQIVRPVVEAAARTCDPAVLLVLETQAEAPADDVSDADPQQRIGVIGRARDPRAVRGDARFGDQRPTPVQGQRAGESEGQRVGARTPVVAEIGIRYFDSPMPVVLVAPEDFPGKLTGVGVRHSHPGSDVHVRHLR